MLKQFEIILTAVCLGLSALFLALIMARVRSIWLKKQSRTPIWAKKVGLPYRLGKIIMALSLLLLAPGLIYFMFVVAVPSAVVRPFAKTLFCVAFGAWALLEAFLCHSIPDKLLSGALFRRAVFFVGVAASAAGAAYLFPLIPKTLPYPQAADCVMLDLPVRGTWLAGQGGAAAITNGHLKNRYAVDILKLGPDGRLFKGEEKAVADFYSFDEPIYAPADGRVTQAVDGMESDSLGNMDKENPGGNIVILDIGGGRCVYFGHLRKGSVAVREGQEVQAGGLLGRVGNSGNSTHPHLHMHVQNKPTSDPEGRVTYPFRFQKMRVKKLLLWREVSGSYLLRNDIFSEVS